MITSHLRINHRQLDRVAKNLPADQAGRERGFAIADSGNQSPYKTARFDGTQLVLLKDNPATGTPDEYGVKLSPIQHVKLSTLLNPFDEGVDSFIRMRSLAQTS